MNAVERRDVRLIVAFRSLSLIGDELALFSLMVHYATSNQKWMVGLLAFINVAPPVFLTSVAGLVIDRVPIKRLLALVSLAQAAAAVGLVVIHSNVGVVVLLLLMGCSVAFTQPGYGTLVTHITPREDMATTMSTMQSAAAVATMSAPVLAGLIYGSFGASTAFAIDAVTFLIVSVVTSLLVHDRIPEPHDPKNKTKGEMWAGMRWLFGDGLLRPVVITTMVTVLALNMIAVAEAILITHDFHGSATVFGLFGASFGVGNLLGSLAARKLPKGDVNCVQQMFAACIILGATFGAIGWAPTLAWVFPLFFAGGIGNGIINVAINTLFATRLPDEIRGRGMAAISTVFTGMTLCSLGLGAVALALVSARTIYQIGGITTLVAIAILGPLSLRQAQRLATTQGA